MDSNKEAEPASNNNFAQWLERLQQESWQLELIISGIALFGIWEARILVGDIRNFMEVYSASPTQNGFFFFLYVGARTSWVILFTNLILHITFRGIWIGAIGLRSVSGEIDYSKLGYNPIFTRFLKKKIGSFDVYIEKLERFASILFAYTFLLLAFTISFAFFSTFLFLSTLVIRNQVDAGEINGVYSISFLFLLLFGGTIVFIDFITLGNLKKIKHKKIAKWYFFLFRFYSLVTLSFIFRPLLYNFLDDKYAKKFFLLSLPYVIIIGFFSGIIRDPIPHFPIQDRSHTHHQSSTGFLSIDDTYYDNKRAAIKNGIFQIKQPIKAISLPQMVFSEKYAEFFLRIITADTPFFQGKKDIDSYNKNEFLHDWKFHSGNHTEDRTIIKFEENRDSLLEKLTLEETDILKKIREGNITKKVIGTKLINKTIQLDRAFWQEKKDSIEEVWKLKLDSVNITKATTLMDAMLELNTITIDGIPYNDSLNCKFSLHSNLGERGLTCYFSTRYLSEGEHTLALRRKIMRVRSQTDTIFQTRKHILPFFFYKEN